MGSVNKWGLVFHEVDMEKQEYKTLLYLTGVENQIKTTFENMKNQFKRLKGEPDCVVSLIDVGDNESTVDDYTLTKMQMTSVATLLGFELSEECIRYREEVE